MSKERKFTREQLRRFHGDGTAAYIAYRGVVYDVSRCPKWRDGIHEGLHWSGQDLSDELQFAPHEEQVFNHSCVKRVGILIDS